MANALEYNTVTGEIKKLHKSVHTPDFIDRPDILINPTIPDLPPATLVVDKGAVRQRTQVEQDDFIAGKKLEQYAYLRQSEYPPIDAQLDALWHAMDRGLLHRVANFYHPIKEVKDKYPKPVEE